MKRNLDLIRQILLEIEGSEGEAPRQIRMPDISEDEINYHLALMIEAGLLQGQVSRTLGPGVPRVMVVKMTWDGHEYLDDIRSDTVWKRTKEKVGEAASSASVMVVREVAVSILRGTLGL